MGSLFKNIVDPARLFLKDPKPASTDTSSDNTPTPPPPPPTLQSPQGEAAAAEARRRAQASFGAAGTIITGPQGLTTAANTTATGTGKTLGGG